MGLYDEVILNHDMFGVHKGEKHQTKSLDPTGSSLEQYEITPSGRLAFLEYVIEDHSNPNAQGIERCSGMLAHVYTGGRRDTNYHGWLEFTAFGRAKFTDGTLVVFEPKAEHPPALHEVAPETETSQSASNAQSLEVPIYWENDLGGTLRIRDGKANAHCEICEYSLTDVWPLEHVIEGFWRHLVFKHLESIDVLGVDGLDKVNPPGISFGVRIVVRSV